jgi:hypothetical protein
VVKAVATRDLRHLGRGNVGRGMCESPGGAGSDPPRIAEFATHRSKSE